MSSSRWKSARTVVESRDAELSVDRLTKAHERFAEQWEGLTWLLARRPEIGRHRVIGDRAFYITHRAGESRFGLCEISVVYTFTDEVVTVVDVEAWTPAPEELP